MPEFFDILAVKIGEVAEWSNALVLKTSVLQGTGGSNPSLSAIGSVVQLVRIQACHAWGREFESRPNRICLCSSAGRASDL